MLLPPASLTRHAVCLGMTGSGKTGLCVGLLEDLAGAGVPVLAVDPKGDLANLALVFPALDAASFAPWVDPGEAVRRGLTVDALAERTAATWRDGLAKAGLGPAELQAWRDRVEVVVMTPGSAAGVPVDVVSSLSRCPEGLDPEGRRAYVVGAVTALLGLVERRADPLNDPATILLVRLLDDAFAAGRDLPLDALVGLVVDPPFDRLGVFPLDEVLPPKARQALAVALNNVLASPAFAAWRAGVPLDLDAWTAPVDGKTPLRVLYLAHLTDAERLFFVALLAHAVLAWTRRLPGTGQLRALLYVDEVFGYLPPHPKDPPSKAPLLTLMKQARAVGVGVVLATQNPVDLDYKALSNAGTWMVGRLQTENDRARVIEGLQTAGVGLSKASLDTRLGALPPRAFVVRDAEGRVGELRSRHTMSFLRGPLTRLELDAMTPDAAPAEAPHPDRASGPAPVPPGVAVRWLDPARVPDPTVLGFPPSDGPPGWQPALYARLDVRFDTGETVLTRTVHRWLAPLAPLAPARPVVLSDALLLDAPPHDAPHTLLPPALDQAAELAALRDRLVDAAVRHERAEVHRCTRTGATSDGVEDRDAFAARVGAQHPADVVTEVLRPKARDVEVGWVGVVWVAG